MTQKNKFFSLKDVQQTPKQISDGVCSVYLNHHLQKIAKVEDLLKFPNPGEIIFLHTEKAFNAFTFIPWIAKTYFIEELYSSTYSISRRVVEALQNLHNSGNVNEVHLMISDSMIKRNPATIENLEAVVNTNSNFSTKYFWNHSKITLIKARLEDKIFHFVLEGSGNWSENAQLEQYIFLENKEVFEFRKTLFEK